MKRIAILLSVALLLGLGFVIAFAPTPRAGAQTSVAAISEADAQAIAAEAYLYFYPLVSMDVTRKQLINTEPSKGLGGPMNTFDNIPAFPTADMRAVVRPNFDTLYSSGWVDLTREPMVISVPDTGGRYYLLPMLDMWTDVFASPGWRTTGTKAANFLLVPPKWNGNVPTGYRASTRRRPMCGSSAAPRPTVRPTMTQSTPSRRVSRSRLCQAGASRQSR